MWIVIVSESLFASSSYLTFVARTSNGSSQSNPGAASRPERKIFSKRGNVEMVEVPRGWFQWGDGGPDRFTKKGKVFLDAFFIGKNDVTVAQFKEYCRDKKIDFSKFFAPEPWKPDGGWIDDHPMVFVTWQQARDFCKWAGGDLPTDAQWDKAARGTDGNMYPWGNQFEGSRLWWRKPGTREVSGPTQVGKFPSGASPYGCLDMVGNVAQWCLDSSDDLYSIRSNRNPKALHKGQSRDVRGSAWDSSPDDEERLDYFLCTFRVLSDPKQRDGSLGFRLACRPKP
jgi:formylglycine-generating enzyme required for sulfatase activity